MLTFLTVLTAGMVMTLVAQMLRQDAPPAPAPTRAKRVGSRLRSTR